MEFMKALQLLFCVLVCVASLATGNQVVCAFNGDANPTRMECCCHEDTDVCTISSGSCCSEDANEGLVPINNGIIVVPEIPAFQSALNRLMSAERLLAVTPIGVVETKRRPLHLASNKVYLAKRLLLI